MPQQDLFIDTFIHRKPIREVIILCVKEAIDILSNVSS